MREHRVMNCKEWDPAKFKALSCVGVKYDGIRGFYYPGESDLWSRQNKILRGHRHIVEACKAQPHILDLELYIPGMEFNKMSGLIRDFNECPQSVAGIIDTPSYVGYLPDRLAARPVDQEGSPIHRIPHFKVTEVAHVKHYYEKWVRDGHEGLVYKTFNHVYKHQRYWHWMRWVPLKNEDVRVVGIYEGKGKMAGMCGGFYVQWGDGTTKVGTLKGIDMAERTNIWWNPDEYMGRLCQIEFKGYQPSGKPRQPRFKRWRDDKDETA